MNFITKIAKNYILQEKTSKILKISIIRTTGNAYIPVLFIHKESLVCWYFLPVSKANTCILIFESTADLSKPLIKLKFSNQLNMKFNKIKNINFTLSKYF